MSLQVSPGPQSFPREPLEITGERFSYRPDAPSCQQTTVSKALKKVESNKKNINFHIIL